MYHYRKNRLTYRKHNKADIARLVCTLCDDTNLNRLVDETETMNLLPNRVTYDVFEGMSVLEHLMIVPKRHVETIADFTKKEQRELIELAGRYEAKGYCVFARGFGSSSRSVKHQHTHLLKLDNKSARAYLYLKKPYFLIKI